MDEAALRRLPAVETALTAARGQVERYRAALVRQRGDRARPRCYAVVAVGLERLLGEEVAPPPRLFQTATRRRTHLAPSVSRSVGRSDGEQNGSRPRSRAASGGSSPRPQALARARMKLAPRMSSRWRSV